jgi:hypothetical protein
MSILQKRKKNPMCALSPHAGIAIEEEKYNMCLGNDMKILYILYLSNGKQIKRMGIASLVLVGFWCLWKYYGFIFLSIYVSKVKALKNFIRKQNDSK